MNLTRRQFALALATLPAGCAFQPLPPLRSVAAAVPASVPAVRPPALGQRWTYRKYNGYNSALIATEVDEVSALSPLVIIRRRSDANATALEEHQQPWGRVLREPGWEDVLNYEQAAPLWPADLSPGSRSAHDTHYRIDNDSFRYWITQRITVRGWEQVALDQATHLALRIEKFIRIQHRDQSRIETTRRDTLWLAPEIGRWVAREMTGEYLIPDHRGVFRGLEDHHRWELVSWT